MKNLEELKKEARKYFQVSSCCKTSWEEIDGVYYCDKCNKFCNLELDKDVINFIDRSYQLGQEEQARKCAEHSLQGNLAYKAGLLRGAEKESKGENFRVEGGTFMEPKVEWENENPVDMPTSSGTTGIIANKDMKA